MERNLPGNANELNELAGLREQIDGIDAELLKLFLRRMDVVKRVAEYKIDNGMTVLQPEREKEVLEKRAASSPSDMAGYAKSFFEALMAVSREMQKDIIKGKK